MTRCPSCGYEFRKGEVTPSSGSTVSCPRCKRSLPNPAATVRFLDQEAIPTIKSTRAMAGSLPDDKKFAVVVVSGNEPGKLFPLEESRVTIGRMGCDISLDDDELSRQHALIAINGGTARLEDLGSTNGTYVDEKRIDNTILDDRTEFRVGGHVLLFSISCRD